MQSQSQNNPKKPRIAGIVATVAFHLLLLLTLLWAALDFVPGEDADRKWPPVKDSEVLYGGEYVVLGEPLQESTPEEAPAVTEPVQPETALPIVQKQESPVKVAVPEEKAPAPTEAELAEQRRIKSEREAARRIQNRVSFGNSSTSTDKKEGQANGNADHGALSGAPGTDLVGRTLASWTKPSGTATGTIVVEVKVNRKGKVVSARYVSGTGPIAASNPARRSCEQAALKSAFSVNDDAPATQTGRITYRFE